MFIIKKTVGKCNYWWNDISETWEGLEDNATRLTTVRLDELMAGFLQQWNAEDYSFAKVGCKLIANDM